jgi:hypothetical protein
MLRDKIEKKKPKRIQLKENKIRRWNFFKKKIFDIVIKSNLTGQP